MIRPATTDDAPRIREIYNHYVLKTIITFEQDTVSVAEMSGRIAETLATLPWLVYDEPGAGVTGYAYASSWKSRCAYRYSVESTVYVDPTQRGRGIGSELYRALIAQLRRRSLHTVIAGIALPNAASVALHESFGFKPVARFQEVGWKFDAWIDVGYWQLVLSPDVRPQTGN